MEASVPSEHNGGPPSEQHDLAELFTRLGRELSSQPRLDDVLATITRRAVDVLPTAEHAAVSRSRANGSFETVAQTSEVPPRVDQIQYELGTGPCVDAVLDDAVLRCGDLLTQSRWPEFGRRAVEQENIHSMLTVRLFLEGGETTAGLNIYSSRRDAFSREDQTTATLLATHGALAMDAAQHRGKADNLQRALQTSRQIGMAMGILMVTHKVTEDQAFGLLRIASQSTHRKLADLAADVAETGTLDLPSLPDRQRSGGSPTR
jgi:GAF domain-containing protein